VVGVDVTARVDDVAKAVLAELGPMDAMKLEKLLYYAQGWHLAVTDRPLFEEPVEAWRDGPVVDAVYQQHKHLRTVHDWPSGDASRLSEDQLQMITLICSQYGHLSGDDLSNLTHVEAPWVVTRGDLPRSHGSRRPIVVDLMKRFFRGRELGGRTTADLAAGGIAMSDVEMANENLRAALEHILADFRNIPAADPPAQQVGRTGSGVPQDVTDRLAKRRANRAATTI
jgi:uncharacterized phage-associated protein